MKEILSKTAPPPPLPEGAGVAPPSEDVGDDDDSPVEEDSRTHPARMPPNLVVEAKRFGMEERR
jgi:hypothetical protein